MFRNEEREQKLHAKLYYSHYSFNFHINYRFKYRAIKGFVGAVVHRNVGFITCSETIKIGRYIIGETYIEELMLFNISTFQKPNFVVV